MMRIQVQSSTKTQTDKIPVLTIRVLTNQEKRVTWHESVIDNEHMNKRKSNKCCIFHKRRDILYNSSSEESSDSDSD